jgi:hypothetical protein
VVLKSCCWQIRQLGLVLSHGCRGAGSRFGHFGVLASNRIFPTFRPRRDLEDADRQTRIISAEELRSAAAEKIWWGRLEPWQFHLYLGVCDKSEVTNLYEAGRQGEDVWLENQERADPEGRSCFAKLKFSPQGTLQLDSLSISTIPWAIGVVRQDGWSQLSEDRFESDVQRLYDRLRAVRPMPFSRNQ